LDATKEEIQQLKAIIISNLEAGIQIQDELQVWMKKKSEITTYRAQLVHYDELVEENTLL
jgi:hypothetical protein